MSLRRIAFRCTEIGFVGALVVALLALWIIWEQDHTKNRRNR